MKKKSTKRSLAMKKRWAEKKRQAALVDTVSHSIDSINQKQAATADPESVKLYEARREGRREGFEDSLDGIIHERDEIAERLKHINIRIAHRRVDLGLLW